VACRIRRVLSRRQLGGVDRTWVAWFIAFESDPTVTHPIFCHDIIVKQHRGSIKVETELAAFTDFRGQIAPERSRPELTLRAFE